MLTKTPKVGEWAVFDDGFANFAVRVSGVTQHMVHYTDERWKTPRGSRRNKDAFYDWCGTQDDAQRLAAAMNELRDNYKSQASQLLRQYMAKRDALAKQWADG